MHRTHALMRFRRCERGATAIEYAFIAMIIGAALVVSLPPLEAALDGLLGRVAGAFEPDAPPPPPDDA